MKRTIVAIIVLAVLAMAGYAVYAYAAVRARVADRPLADLAASLTSGDEAGLSASGIIQATSISIASEMGGRIARLQVAEGDQVAAGDLIAEMDTTLLDWELEKARAAVAVAEAQLALLEAGTPDTDIAVARAALAQAEAAAQSAYVAWQDAQALLDAPDQLDVKIAETRAELQAMTEEVTAAEANARAADLEQGLWERVVQSLSQGFDVQLPTPGGGTVHVEPPADKMNRARFEWNMASQRTWQAYANLNTAIAARDALGQALADLERQKASPLELQSQADAARSAYDIAQATVVKAGADVDLLLAGAREEKIAAARAAVDQAEAAVQALLAKRDQARVIAPQDGRISEAIRHAGEVVAPGSPIAKLADLSEVRLTVYVPEPRLGEVHLGQPVQVMVDAFPGRRFPGLVTYIADRAAFTPKNVQTVEERANTVFAVRITLPNPEGLLKPGMPADAFFDGAMGPEQPRAAAATNAATQDAITAAGTIEGKEVIVSGEQEGRVVRAAVAEGDQVSKGQVLVELDKSELTARREVAQAALAAAQANLAEITAPPRPAEVARAEADVQVAEAALAAAKTELENARKLRNTPQELDAQINSARAQIAIATAQVDAARADLKAAQVLQASLPADTGSDQDRTTRAIYDQGVIAAEASLRAAEARETGARSVLAMLLEIRDHPVGLDAAVHQAEGKVAQAEAGVKMAKAALAQVQAPAQPEAIALARAQVDQAEAALASLDAQIAQRTIKSPVNGTITAQAIHVGEVARAGTTLVKIVDLEQISLEIYIPTDRIGEVAVGQPAYISVDAYPGRQFRGAVTHIADEAEFTPKNVQTKDERVNTVFAVRLRVENQDGALKPGMPADATLIAK